MTISKMFMQQTPEEFTVAKKPVTTMLTYPWKCTVLVTGFFVLRKYMIRCPISGVDLVRRPYIWPYRISVLEPVLEPEFPTSEWFHISPNRMFMQWCVQREKIPCVKAFGVKFVIHFVFLSKTEGPY